MARLPKYKIEELKNYFSSRNCKLLSKEFKDVDNPLNIMFSCGHIGKRSLSDFQTGTSLCFDCSRTISYITNKDITEMLKNTKYNYVGGQYKNNHSKLSFEDNDEYKYYVSYTQIKIAIRDSKTLAKFDPSNIYTCYNIINWLQINQKPIVLLSTEYKGAKDKLVFKCLICLGNWESKWNNIMNGKGCPHCASYKGELKIFDLLEKWKFYFTKQAIFDGCSLDAPLRFDFYIPNLNLCIEFQGKQHFEPLKFFGGEEGFKYQIIRDNFKRNYCKLNKIKLLEIPYWEFDNIENILIKELSL